MLISYELLLSIVFHSSVAQGQYLHEMNEHLLIAWNNIKKPIKPPNKNYPAEPRC